MRSESVIVRFHNWLLRTKAFLYTWYYRRLFNSPSLKVYGPITVFFPERVSLGLNVRINEQVFINARGGVTIGSNVHLSSGAQIQTSTLDITTGKDAGLPISIASNAWIYMRALLLPNVSIGQGAIVGAAAVVTKDVPDKAVVAGVPALPIR